MTSTPPPGSQPPTTPGERPAPPPPTQRPVRGDTGTLAILPLVLGAIAAVVVFVTSFLDWLSFEAGLHEVSEQGTDVPVQFLWDTIPGSDDPSLLVVLLPAAALIVLGAIIGQVRLLAVVGGAVAVIVAVVFVIQTGRLLDDLGVDLGTFDALGIAPYVCFVAGAVGIVAGLLPRSD